MPTLTNDDVLKLRSSPHRVSKYLSIQPRRVVFQAQVNGTPSIDAKTGGVYAFAFDNVVSGVYTNVEVGETLTIGTTPLGDDIGYTRVRKLATSTVMSIAETSYGKLPITDNMYVTVYEQYQPWSKAPRLTAVKNKASYTNSFTEYHDYDEVYTNQNTQIKPVANITVSPTSRRQPKPAAWVDDGELFRTIELSSAFSYSPSGGSIVSRSWELDDGTITVGVVSSTNITATFPVGFRMITLIVVDNNSKTTYRHYPIWTHHPTLYPPLSEDAGFSVNSDVRDEGREMSFEFFGYDDSLTIPKGTALCYWEDADFDNEIPPDQYIDSFLGWALQDGETLKLNDTSQYRVSVGGIQAWLSQFTGFATTITDVTTVNRWFKMPNITVDKIALYVLREYSTALLVSNFYPSGITTTAKAEEVKKSDIWNQIVELQKGNQYSSVIADSLNGIWCRPHYSYRELDERVDVDIVINLDARDWTDAQGLVLDEEVFDRVSVVTGSGSFIQNNKNKLIYSKAPGLVPAMAGNDEEAPFQRLAHSTALPAQTRLNRFTGHHFKRVNNPRGEVTLELSGNYDIIEAAWGEPVTLTWLETSLLTDSTTLSSAEFLVTRISVTHSNEFGQTPKKITWTLEQVTIGEPGVTYTPPKSNINLSLGSIVFPKISLPTIQPFEWVNIPPSVPTLAAVQQGQHQGSGIYRDSVYIADFGDVQQPQFTERTFALGGEELVAFGADPFSPYYVGTGTSVNGWCITNDGIWRISDVFASTAGTALQLTFADTYNGIDSARLEVSRTIQTWCIATHASFISGDLSVWYTTDGITWTESLTLGYSFIDVDPIDFIHMSEKIAGLVYLGYRQRLYRSTDYGATWTVILDGEFSQISDGHWVHVPKHDNPRDRILWFAKDGLPVDALSIPPNQNSMYRVDLDNVSFATIRPLPWIGGGSGLVFYINKIVQSSKNPGKLVAIVQNHPDFRVPSVSSKLFTSIDGGSRWLDIGAGGGAKVNVRLADSNSDYFIVYGEQESEPPFNVGYPDATKGFIVSTNDFGKNFTDRSGNLISLDPGGIANKTSRILEVIGA